MAYINAEADEQKGDRLRASQRAMCCYILRWTTAEWGYCRSKYRKIRCLPHRGHSHPLILPIKEAREMRVGLRFCDAVASRQGIVQREAEFLAAGGPVDLSSQRSSSSDSLQIHAAGSEAWKPRNCFRLLRQNLKTCSCSRCVRGTRKLDFMWMWSLHPVDGSTTKAVYAAAGAAFK